MTCLKVIFTLISAVALLGVEEVEPRQQTSRR